MKTALFLCLLCPISLTAQTGAKKTTAPAPRTGSGEVKIPEGAVKTKDGNYRFTDSKGKKWIYRETPFGIAKFEDKPADPTDTPFGKAKAQIPDPASTPVEGKDLTVAYDEGDTIRFERPTPFGTSTWRKKKTDLTATEQKILDQQKSKQK